MLPIQLVSDVWCDFWCDFWRVLRIHSFEQFVIRCVCVLGARADIAVPQQTLNHFQIAGRAQEPRSRRVPKIVQPQGFDTGFRQAVLKASDRARYVKGSPDMFVKTGVPMASLGLMGANIACMEAVSGICATFPPFPLIVTRRAFQSMSPPSEPGHFAGSATRLDGEPDDRVIVRLELREQNRLLLVRRASDTLDWLYQLVLVPSDSSDRLVPILLGPPQESLQGLYDRSVDRGV